tara:strand:- start:248 stop:442 length:195 start_codon:yes stop_codon:yes gene_type:complete
MEENYLDKVILSSIDSMSKSIWEWPSEWSTDEKLGFLDECLIWLEKNEHYEKCEVIVNEKKKLS